MTLALVLAGAMLGALVLYALMAGADFGGGVWDLLAAGPRRKAQRKLIEKALGPIWEANHVWLILAVVLLFAGFPRAFGALTAALHVPLTLFLVGVVFRGSAFTFRAYDLRGDLQQRRWGTIFSVASVLSPLPLGIAVGALASGRIRLDGNTVTSGFFWPWIAPFPIVAGIFALSLFAFLSAVYLANEASSPDLAEDFRKRALLAGVVVGLLAIVAFVLSFSGAPRIREGLTERMWTWPLHFATGIAAVTAFYALTARRYALARAAAAAQVALVVLGWAASQYPYIIVPDITIDGAAASAPTLRLLLGAIALGSVFLMPSLYLLYKTFKGRSVFGDDDAPMSRVEVPKGSEKP